MGRQSARLVDHKQLIVLEQNVKVQTEWSQVVSSRIPWLLKLDRLPFHELQRGLGDGAIH